MGVKNYIGQVNSTELVLGVIVIGVVAGFAYRGLKEAGEIISDIGSAINPVNDDNIINQGVSKIVQDTTGGKHQNLGAWLYCKVNPDALICRVENEPVLKESV